MRSNVEAARLLDNLLMAGNRLGVSNRTLGADLVLANGEPHVLFVDPGGAARNLDLPASPQKGDFFVIFNTADAAEVITVRASGGGGLTPAITPAQSECAFVVYTGAAWKGFVAIGA